MIKSFTKIKIKHSNPMYTLFRPLKKRKLKRHRIKNAPIRREVQWLWRSQFRWKWQWKYNFIHKKVWTYALLTRRIRWYYKDWSRVHFHLKPNMRKRLSHAIKSFNLRTRKKAIPMLRFLNKGRIISIKAVQHHVRQYKKRNHFFARSRFIKLLKKL